MHQSMQVAHFASLDQGERVLAEYVWIGGGKTTGGFDMRSKTKVLSNLIFIKISKTELFDNFPP